MKITMALDVQVYISIIIIVQHAYQYYKNTRGEIHSVDNLVLQRNKKYYDWSYYYQ